MKILALTFSVNDDTVDCLTDKFERHILQNAQCVLQPHKLYRLTLDDSHNIINYDIFYSDFSEYDYHIQRLIDVAISITDKITASGHTFSMLKLFLVLLYFVNNYIEPNKFLIVFLLSILNSYGMYFNFDYCTCCKKNFDVKVDKYFDSKILKFVCGDCAKANDTLVDAQIFKVLENFSRLFYYDMKTYNVKTTELHKAVWIVAKGFCENICRVDELDRYIFTNCCK